MAENDRPNQKPGNSDSDRNKSAGEQVKESVSTKEYILLDKTFYKYDNATDTKSKGGKRYKQGDTVSLTDDEARTLLAPPRPSVREKSKEDNDKDD